MLKYKPSSEITENEYKSLWASYAKLVAMERCGVDNWDGNENVWENVKHAREQIGLPAEEE